METEALEKHAIPIIYLFKGVLYSSTESVWKLLLQHEHEIKKYFKTVGLNVFIDEAEGYAYLRQVEYPEEETPAEYIPKLVEKRPLTYPVTLLCILLRKRLLEHDLSGGEPRLILSTQQIEELIRIFLPDNSAYEKKIVDKISTYINKVKELGFLRELKGDEDKYEVSRILNAYIPIEKLQQLLEKLESYHQSWLESVNEKRRNELEL